MIAANEAPVRFPADSVPSCGRMLVSTIPPQDRLAGPLDAVVVSDVHLGAGNCRPVALRRLLEEILEGRMRTRRLIFNGDLFDSIDFRRLKKHHWKVLSMIRHLSDKIEVVWIAGNHDGPAETLSNLLGVSFVSRYILSSGSRRILALHGHQFDRFVQDHPVLTRVADCIYAVLQAMDSKHRIARLAKRRSKVFLRCELKVRDGAMAQARQSKCDTVLCAHTHHPVADAEGPIRYYNSGCWTERPSHYLTVRDGAVELRSSGVESEGEPQIEPQIEPQAEPQLAETAG
jgi:UDP-2,3-diacylglucosamine pyrophosphatase LpxH